MTIFPGISPAFFNSRHKNFETFRNLDYSNLPYFVGYGTIGELFNGLAGSAILFLGGFNIFFI